MTATHRTKTLVFTITMALLLVVVNSAPKREIVTKVAEKLNEILPHFSKVLEIGVNEDNELGVYAKEDIYKGLTIMHINSDYVLPSFEEYYRTYYFSELIKGD